MAFVFAGIVFAVPAQASSIGDILSPYGASQGVCVYEGYSSGTHTGTSQYGLDLVTGNCSSTSAGGLAVYAPLAGTVAYTPGATGDLCINVAGSRSITLTHIATSLTSGASVAAGQLVGAVGTAGSYGNNGVAHVHFQIWSAVNCWNNSKVPFDTADSARICGAPDMTATGGTGTNGVWSGTVFVGTSCSVHLAYGDYNNDGTTDMVVFRPSDGGWHIRGVTDFVYGQSGDIPVPGDYDGNGTIEAAVYRPSTNYWYVRGGASIQYGQSGDIPVPGDYNNDGTTDIAVFRPSDGSWHIRLIGDFVYGQSGDIPVPGDYDGNGTIEAAVYRPSTNYWYVRGGVSVQYGQASDVVVPADYDGNGTTDVAVFRPSDGGWHIRNVGDFSYGQSGDIPMVGDYDGNGTIEAAVYRPSTNYWYVRGGISAQYGQSGDIPVSVFIDK
ncbi:MAG: hypothetical protein JWO99_25 [Candidatus Saccharibacteria bacterium]|nr:hypothetical protein [Candidatus Saccharibacteria bacterium]